MEIFVKLTSMETARKESLLEEGGPIAWFLGIGSGGVIQCGMNTPPSRKATGVLPSRGDVKMLVVSKKQCSSGTLK